MSKLNLYIVRHGKTLMNTLDRVQGWCDSPLTAEGLEMVRHLGLGLKDVEFRSAYCSDLRRTRQTVVEILDAKEQKGLPITELEGLREVCFGGFEADFNYTMWNKAAISLNFNSLENMYQSILDKKITYGRILDEIHMLDKNGMGMAESFAQVEKRTQDSLRGIAMEESSNGEGNILIVAHGMCILCMLHSLGGDKLLYGHLENASVCYVTYHNGEFEVELMGDMSYLKKGREIYNISVIPK